MKDKFWKFYVFLMLNKGLAVMIAIGVFFEVTIDEFGNHKWYVNKTTIRK